MYILTLQHFKEEPHVSKLSNFGQNVKATEKIVQLVINSNTTYDQNKNYMYRQKPEAQIKMG